MCLFRNLVVGLSTCAMFGACGGGGDGSARVDGSAMGGNSSGGAGGVSAAGGSAGGALVDAGAGGSIDNGPCAAALPPCLNGLSACLPVGACMSSSSFDSLLSDPDAGVPASVGLARCYANGVKETVSLSVATQAGTATLTKNGAVCYVVEIPNGVASTSAPAMFTVKNGAGQTVATIGNDALGNETITCAGGTQATPFPMACAALLSGTLAGDDCPVGLCP